jgi:hypothetical protein
LAPFISMYMLLISFPSFYTANEVVYNSTKTLSDFIKNKHLDKRVTTIYNRLRPSIVFNLNKTIISLNNGDNTLSHNCDSQFEKDTLWKKILIDLRKPSGLNYYKKLIEKPSVLIILTKEAKEDSLKWLLKPYSKMRKFKKWQVYY